MIGLLVLFVLLSESSRRLDCSFYLFCYPRALDDWTARFICFIIREL